MTKEVRYATEAELEELIEDFRERVIVLQPGITRRELDELVRAALQDVAHQ